MPISAQANQIGVQVEYPCVFFLLGPVDRIHIAKPFVLEKFLALEDHGIPGDVKTSAAPKGERFRAK